MVTIVVALFGLLQGVAWPLALVAIAAFYKPEILAHIPHLFSLLLRSRKIRISSDGVEAEFDAAEKQQVGTELAKACVDRIELKEIPGLSRSAAIANLERELHGHLRDVADDKIDVLVRNLAQARLEAKFGLIYSPIFGSQLLKLKDLAARRKIPTDELHSYYLEIEKNFPNVYLNYGFAGWLGFLKENDLAATDGDCSVITDVGNDFLLWMKATRLSFNKPF